MRLGYRLRRGARDGGQSTVEYVGLSTVVLVLLLAISHVDVDDRLVAALGRKICSALLAAPCSGSAAAIADAQLADLDPCPLRAANTEEAVNATVLSLRGASADYAVVEEYSDGTVLVTFRDDEELGVEVGAGVGISFEGVRGVRGGGLRAEAGAGVGLVIGKAYEFASGRRAAVFLERYAHAETMGGEARNRYLAACLGCRALGARPAAAPEPDATFLEGGASARARADGAAGAVGAGIDGFVRAAAGRRVDHGTGQRTYYYDIDGDGSGGIAALLGIAGAGASLAARDEGGIALRVAADGTPLELTVGSTRAYSGSLEGSLAVPSLSGMADRGSGFGSAQRASGRLVEYEAVLDLRNDVLSREAAVRLVRALPPGTNPVELAGGVDAVRERIGAVGELNLRTFDSRESGRGFEGAGALAVTIGGGFERVESQTSLTGAYTRPAGAVAFVDRIDCLGRDV